MDVSVIIVNYNTKSILKDCLDSIYKFTKELDFEVIVSDNGSTDGSVEMLQSDFPQVVLIENNKNLGFGKANNRGLKIARGKYIFYLNSDTVLLNNAVKFFFDYWETHKDEKIGALGCNLKNTQLQITHSYGRIIPLKERVFSLFHTWLGVSRDTIKYFFLRKKEPVEIEYKQQDFMLGEVPYIIGADLFVKNNDFAQFDERFFMYTEEVDMQIKMHRNGLRTELIAGPEIIHLEGGSWEKKLYKIFYLSTLGTTELFISNCRFYEKNENKKVLLLLLKLAIILIWLNPIIAKNGNTLKRIPCLFRRTNKNNSCY